jgi:hypothetical protein
MSSLGGCTETKNDIGQIEGAIAEFQRKFGSKEYFPSRLVLCENFEDYFKQGKRGQVFRSQLHEDSWHFLSRMFPRMSRIDPKLMDWNGNGVPGDKPVVLQGDQCLVFFLGGIPAPGQPGCLGFSVNRSNPTTPGGDRIGPLYDFDPKRLVDFHHNGFYSYLDPYGQKPYAFFSSYRQRNGYNRYLTLDRQSDCAALGVWPYAEAFEGQTPRYLMPSGFQILSAGADGRFGPGTDLTAKSPFTWTPATAKQTLAPGKDDQSNFYSGRLGEPH